MCFVLPFTPDASQWCDHEAISRACLREIVAHDRSKSAAKEESPVKVRLWFVRVHAAAFRLDRPFSACSVVKRERWKGNHDTFPTPPMSCTPLFSGVLEQMYPQGTLTLCQFR